MDKKGTNILMLDIRDQAVFTDFFLLCNGESERQLLALADGISETAKKEMNILPWGIEGEASSGWLLVDFGDVVVHLFSTEKRRYYDLDELWGESHVVLRMQ